MPDEGRTIYYEEISVCSKYEYEDEDEILDTFNEIKQVQLPNKFLNRRVDIDEDDPTESEIFFGETGEESPEDAENRFEVDISDEGEIHIHPYLDSNTVEDGKILFNRLTSIMGKGMVKITLLEGMTPGNYNNLNFPDFSDSDKEITGLRFKYEESNFLFQDVPITESEEDASDDPDELEEEQISEDSEDEEEEFESLNRAIYFRLSKEDRLAIDSGNTFIEERLDTYEQYLDEFLE